MKVKIFSGVSSSFFEDKVNDFIKNKEIIDIKFQKEDKTYYAFIMYKEV